MQSSRRYFVLSIYLDQDLGPEIGPTNNNFQPTNNTKIFVENESITRAQHIIDNNGQQSQQEGCYVMVYKTQDKDKKEVLFETNLYSEIKT